MNLSQLPQDVQDALAQGNLVAAIKRLRDAKGIGLKEAKEIIDLQARGIEPRPAAQPMREGLVPPGVLEALAQGRKLEAIRLYRERAGTGLKQAKDAVDKLALTHGVGGTGGIGGLAPGEVPRTSSGTWVTLAVAVAAGAAAWLLLR